MVRIGDESYDKLCYILRFGNVVAYSACCLKIGVTAVALSHTFQNYARYWGIGAKNPF